MQRGLTFLEGGFFGGQKGSQNFRFSMIFAFTTFVKKNPYMEKLLLKCEKYVFKISHLIFWRLQAAKCLIYDYFYFLNLLFFCLNVIPPIALGA